jgi:hypothetical protein
MRSEKSASAGQAPGKERAFYQYDKLVERQRNAQQNQ